MRSSSWIPALLLACAPRTAPDPTAGLEDVLVPEALPAAEVPPEVPVPGLEALACTARDCFVWSPAGLQRLDATGSLGDPVPAALEPGVHALLAHDEGLAVLLPCPPTPPPRADELMEDPELEEREVDVELEVLCLAALDPATGSMGKPISYPLDEGASARDPVALREGWNRMREAGWRVPFALRVPTRDGGTLGYLRGAGGSQAQLTRTGRSARMESWPATRTPVSYPRWLAMHPTGAEAFLLTWPEPTLTALDPDSLEARWELHLRGPAHGLFVDATGRWLVLAEGGAVDAERLLDYDEAPAPWLPGRDPSEDAALRRSDRPASSSTVVVDLSGPRLAARLAGAYRGFARGPDGTVWLASDRGLTRVSSPAPDG